MDRAIGRVRGQRVLAPALALVSAFGALPNVFPAQRGAHGLTHGDDGGVPRGRRVLPDVNLDSIRDAHPSPDRDGVVVVARDGVRSQSQRWRQRRRDASFERVTGEVLHLPLDELQRRAFALTDLDGEQLEEVPVVVGGGRPGSLRAVKKSTRHVEPNRSSTRRGARRSVCRTHTRGVHERGDMCGEPTRIPGRVLRMCAQQCDW